MPPSHIERSVVDAKGLFWAVGERDSTHDPGARESTCLIFERPDVVRRVWAYPPTWRALSDDQLRRIGCIE
jgi:hypothetical protein